MFSDCYILKFLFLVYSMILSIAITPINENTLGFAIIFKHVKGYENHCFVLLLLYKVQKGGQN